MRSGRVPIAWPWRERKMSVKNKENRPCGGGRPGPPGRRMWLWEQHAAPKQAADDEPTGPSSGAEGEDDLWTVVDDTRSESAFSLVEDAQSECSFVASEAANWDVRSVASMSSWVSTAPAEHAIDGGGGTASTTGLPVPLAAVPVALLRGAGAGSHTEDDARSLASINTRRGWPRISPNATTPPEHTRPASYRDILLLAVPPAPPPVPQSPPARRGASQAKHAAEPHGDGKGLVPPFRHLRPNAPAPPTLAPVVRGHGGRLELACGRQQVRRRASGLGSAVTRYAGRSSSLASLPEGTDDDDLYEAEDVE